MVTIRPRHVMTHDNTGAVLPKFRAIGATRVADPAQPVFALDHNVQDTHPGEPREVRGDRGLRPRAGHRLPPGRRRYRPPADGRERLRPPRHAWSWPRDSHSNMYGALAAVGTPVVRTDAAAIWATGRTWWQVPRTVKVVLEGRLRPGVDRQGRDHHPLRALQRTTRCSTPRSSSPAPASAACRSSERMTIANMTTEWGALVGWFPFDDDDRGSTCASAPRASPRRGIADRLDRAR